MFRILIMPIQITTPYWDFDLAIVDLNNETYDLHSEYFPSSDISILSKHNEEWSRLLSS